MNPDLNRLHPYPFERLAQLKAGITPQCELSHIAFVLEELVNSLDKIANYPVTKGMPALRQSIANWLNRRFKLPRDGINSLDIEKNILPVNGTREALFAFAQAVIDPTNKTALVLMPNPFYQIYEGAAFLAGAEPYFYNTTADTQYLPDFEAIDDATWQRCQLIYICTPGNPTGAVMPKQQMQWLINKAETFDFIIASDECYSEIYFDDNEAPCGVWYFIVYLNVQTCRACVLVLLPAMPTYYKVF